MGNNESIASLNPEAGLDKFGRNLDSFLKKILVSKIFWAIFCGFGFFFPIYRSLVRTLPPELPSYFKLPDFNLVDENGNNFGMKDLQGKVFIANFIFTSCASTCPGQTEKMQIIQKRIRGVGTKMGIVSFTVDPENDTPATLFKYARKYHANPYIWHFLTGSRKELESLLVSGFKVAMGKKEILKGVRIKTSETNATENLTLLDISHSERFILVDSSANVRGFYSTDNESINKMMIDVGLLINRTSSKNNNWN